MREKIYNVIEPRSTSSKAARLYDFFMVVVITASFVPLCFRDEFPAMRVIDAVAATIFIIDYILRWITADLKFKEKGVKPFLRYPFSPMAIIDLLSILPIVVAVHPALRAFRAARLVMALRFLRIIRLFRYSKNISIIVNVLKKNRGTLLLILLLVIGYILLTSIIIFQVETTMFTNYFDAVYWSTISLMTIGYGDYYPVTDVGKLITIISSIMGVAVVALPSGVIITGYMNEVNEAGKELREEYKELEKKIKKYRELEEKIEKNREVSEK